MANDPTLTIRPPAASPGPSSSTPSGVDVARWFHEAYETLAPSYAYETRPASAVPWEDVPEQNRRLMVATALEVLAQLREARRGSFAWALDALRAGERVRRRGWNGAGLYVVYTPEKRLAPSQLTAEHRRQHPESKLGATIEARLDIHTASGSVSLGWRPTSLDMLADDWEVLDELPF